MKITPTVSIIGFGRFGQVLHRLLKDDFSVTLFQRHPIHPSLLSENTQVAASIQQAYLSDVVFFAIPIESFERVIKDHKKFFRNDQLLIDVLSIKTLPSQIFTRELAGTKTRALLTHPMFGPDSICNGFTGLPIVINRFNTTNQEFVFWKRFFLDKGLKVIEMSPEEHDKTVAHTQALTHFIGRLLDQMNVKSTSIDTPTFKKLLEVRETICKDTSQLFRNIQVLNPQSSKMRKKLKIKFNQLFNELETSSDTITKGEILCQK